MLRRCLSPGSGPTSVWTAINTRSNAGMESEARRRREFGQRARFRPIPGILETRMTDPNAPRHRRPPLMDPLGKLCTEGKDLASYLWQVPHDEGARKRIVDLLARIG